MNKKRIYIILAIALLIIIIGILIILKLASKNKPANGTINKDNSNTVSNITTNNKSQITLHINKKDNCFYLTLNDSTKKVGGYSLTIPSDLLKDIEITSSNQTKLIKTSSSIEGLILADDTPYNLGKICLNKDIDKDTLFNNNSLKFYEVQTGRPLSINID